MARYGAFKYGSGTKYGNGAAVVLPDPVGEVTWILTVNWSGSSGYNEASNMIDLQVNRGNRFYLGSGGGGFETISTGTMTATLDNRGNRYDPYNAGSAIYPHVAPGAAVRLRVKINSTGVTHNVFSGILSDIRPVSGKNDIVRLEAVDYLKWVADRKVSIPAHYNIPLSTAIGYVLDDANFPETRSIQTTTQPIYIFDPAEVDAYTIIQDLAAANLGQFFIDKSGKAVFYDLKYNAMTSHSIDQAVILKEIMVAQPWENKRDQITVEVNRRARLENATIWQGGPYVVQFWNYQDIEVSFSQASSLTIPVRWWGIKVTALRWDGVTVDITQACWVEILSYTSTSAKLRLHNGTGYVGTFQYVKLQGCQHVSSPTVCKYGTGYRTFTLSSPWLQDSGYGNAYDDLLYTHLSGGSKNPQIRIEQRPATQYALELFDKVVFTAAARWINGTWYIGGLEHKWNEASGQSVTTTLYLQNRLQSAAAITPEPWTPVPEQPPTPIPNDPNPDEPVIPPPDTSDCVTDSAVANGPFEIQPNNNYLWTYTGLTQTDIPYPCTLRPGTAANKSYLKIYGDYQYQTYATVTSTSLWTVSAIDANGVDIINGVNTQDSAVTDGYSGNRYATFSPAGAMTVTGFRIAIPAAAGAGNYTHAWDFNDGFQSWVRCYGDESNGATIDLNVTNFANWEWYTWNANFTGIKIVNTSQPKRQAIIYYPTDLYTKMDGTTDIEAWVEDHGEGTGSAGAWIDEDGSGLMANAVFVFIYPYSYTATPPTGFYGKKFIDGNHAGKRILALYYTARDEGTSGAEHGINEFRITGAELHNTHRYWNLSKLELYNVCGEAA